MSQWLRVQCHPSLLFLLASLGDVTRSSAMSFLGAVFLLPQPRHEAGASSDQEMLGLPTSCPVTVSFLVGRVRDPTKIDYRGKRLVPTYSILYWRTIDWFPSARVTGDGGEPRRRGLLPGQAVLAQGARQGLRSDAHGVGKNWSTLGLKP